MEMACPFEDDCTDIRIPSLLVPIEARDAIFEVLETAPKELFHVICRSRNIHLFHTSSHLNLLKGTF